MRIASFLPRSGLWAERLDALAASQPAHDFILDPERAAAAAAEADAVVGNSFPAGFLEAATSLKALFVPFAGVNHLPTALLLGRGVRVFNAHGNAAHVAERALAMTLAFYGRVVEFHRDLEQGQWHGFWVGHGVEDQWPSLYGRRACVFGAGAIGTALAHLLAAFDCEVTAWRRRPEAPLPPGFSRAEPSFEKAVADNELLFVTLPLTPETKGLFSKDVLLGAKGKFLVNVGRGEVVDEEGLWLALRDGILAGAAIDTWYVYPPAGQDRGAPSRFPIHTLPNVILSPHVAGSAREAARANVEQTIENMRLWLEAGGGPREVDLSRLY
jgi:phosphoglycerate dehydrogenase-like enzyme